MKKKEKIIILKEILIALGDDGTKFEINNDIAFVKPIGNCYRGICIDDSRFSKEEFYIEIFFVPLYIPTDHVYFNNGLRLTRNKNEDTWKKGLLKDIVFLIKQNVLEKLLYSNTDEKLLNIINELNEFSNNLKTLETRLILAARMGNEKIIYSTYTEIKLQINQDSFPWQKNILERIELIIHNYKNRNLILDITDKWKEESIQKLKLLYEKDI